MTKKQKQKITDAAVWGAGLFGVYLLVEHYAPGSSQSAVKSLTSVPATWQQLRPRITSSNETTGRAVRTQQNIPFMDINRPGWPGQQ